MTQMSVGWWRLPSRQIQSHTLRKNNFTSLNIMHSILFIDVFFFQMSCKMMRIDGLFHSYDFSAVDKPQWGNKTANHLFILKWGKPVTISFGMKWHFFHATYPHSIDIKTKKCKNAAKKGPSNWNAIQLFFGRWLMANIRFHECTELFSP